jgi:hypothetical protein
MIKPEDVTWPTLLFAAQEMSFDSTQAPVPYYGLDNFQIAL